MARTKQTARETTGGKAPALPRHLRNRDVLLRKGQYFTPAALKRTRRQFLLGRLYRFMVPFVRAKVITGLRRRWIYERGKLVRCRRMPKRLSKCICTMVCGWLDESALQSLALCSVPHARICALISKVWFCTRFDDLRQLAGGALNAFAHTQEKHESPLASLLAGWDGKAGDCIGEWEGAIHEADRNVRAEIDATDRRMEAKAFGEVAKHEERCHQIKEGSGVPAMWALYLQCTEGIPSSSPVVAHGIWSYL